MILYRGCVARDPPLIDETFALSAAAAVPVTAEPTPMLTRETIRDGILQDMIARADPTVHILTPEELTASRRAILAAGPGTGAGDVWVFGYGSLIWNPAFHFREQRIGRIQGYHRRYCLWTHLGRGSPAAPGLMLALEPGGSCRGVAFRIAADAVEEELEIVWRREMVTGAYRPRWVTVLTDGKPIPAIAFTMNRTYERYAGRLSDETVASVLATACGPMGHCADYLFNTIAHLDALGIADRALHRLGEAVREKQRRAGG